MNQHIDLPSLAVECDKVIRRAKAALGEDLCGYSKIDLVADQIDYAHLDDLQAALKLLELPHG